MSHPKITRKKEKMEDQKPQLTTEQLNLAMENYQKQKAQEREQQAESEFKVWQLNIFKQRSEFWKEIFEATLETVDFNSPDKIVNPKNPMECAKSAASY